VKLRINVMDFDVVIHGYAFEILAGAKIRRFFDKKR
jgi:hypothetical protein